MDEKRMPSEFEVSAYEQATQAFTWSFQQDVVTFLRTLHEKGIGLNWAIACIMIKSKMIITTRKDRRDARIEWEKKGRKCPECKQIMYLARVNHSPATMVGGGYRTQWVCPGHTFANQRKDGSFCEFVEYSKRSVTDWLKKLRINPERLKKIQHPYIRNAEFDFVKDLTKENENAD